MSRYTGIPPTRKEVFQTARRAIDIFAQCGIRCCLVGGAACALYGNDRTPCDVDLVVLDSKYDQESLKRLLTQSDSMFYLVEPRTRGATYKVLWARLSNLWGYSCKVDILVPGILNIPHVAASDVITINGFPVMPMLPLLLLKLQAWTDHRVASMSYLRAKQYTDIQDIKQLLRIAVGRGEKVNKVAWMPTDFLEAGRARVQSFTSMIEPETGKQWRALGFVVPVERRKVAGSYVGW